MNAKRSDFTLFDCVILVFGCALSLRALSRSEIPRSLVPLRLITGLWEIGEGFGLLLCGPALVGPCLIVAQWWQGRRQMMLTGDYFWCVAGPLTGISWFYSDAV